MNRSRFATILSFLPDRLSFIFFLITFLLLLFSQANAADLTLAWDASPDSDVSVYRVYYRTQSNPYTTHTYEGSNLSCTISGLSEGQTYYFVATAINSYGESNYSGEISYTVPIAPPSTYTINASAGSNGRISPSGTVSVTAGSSQAFTITPNSGYVIADVRVNNVSVGARSSYTFSNVRSNQSISATFIAAPPSTYIINASAGSNGRISPSGAVSVTAGSSQGFNITPDSGYVIADVRVNNVSVGAVSSYTFSNVRSNQSISATFTAATPTTYTISASAGSNGRISPSGTVSVTAGTSQNFTITANSGYVIADVMVNNTPVGAVPDYTFSDVRSNQSISVSFVIPSDNQAPDQPTLLIPGHRETDVELTPLLEIAGFSDPDVDDGHAATRWQIATDSGFENLILDITSDADSTNHYLVSFRVPQGSLSGQELYYWRVMVKDDRTTNALWSTWSQVFRFTTTDPVQADGNGNGVPDDLEPETSDLDADGQNDNDQPLMRVLTTNNEEHQVGIKALDGVDLINYFAPIDPNNVPDTPGPENFPYGLLNLNLQLTSIGGTARIEIYLPEPPDTQYRWFKYDPVNGWYEYPVFIEGGKYILEITDGGFGDADGIANGIIVDPIGMSSAGIETSNVVNDSFSVGSNGSGGGGCFILTTSRGDVALHRLAIHLSWIVLVFSAALMRKHESRRTKS